MIRYGGHNQGGGGEQGSEIWTFDPRTARGSSRSRTPRRRASAAASRTCSTRSSGRYIRFPAFSASHGWQWLREVYLNDASVWTYDLATNTWRNMRPLPTAHPRPLRCAVVGQRAPGDRALRRRREQRGDLGLRSLGQRLDADEPQVEPAPRSGGNMAYDRRTQAAHAVRRPVRQRPAHLGLRPADERVARPGAARRAADRTERRRAHLRCRGRHACWRSSRSRRARRTRPHTGCETWASTSAENRWTAARTRRASPIRAATGRGSSCSPPSWAWRSWKTARGAPGGPAEQQIWAYATGEPNRRPRTNLPLPRGLTIKVGREAISLAWQPVAGAAAYTVYRGEGERPWKVDYQ